MNLKAPLALVAILALLAMHDLCVAEAYPRDEEFYEDGRHDNNDHYPYDQGDEQYGGYVPTIPAPRVTDISPNGQSMSELSQIFWQWILRFNLTSSPISASNPLDCNYGIVGGGDVLIIGGVIGAPGDEFTTTRNCHLSSNIKAIFIPLLNSETDTVDNVADLNKPGGWLSNTSPNAIRGLTTAVYLTVKSDGRKVHIPGWPHSKEHQTQFIKDNYYVVTPMFNLAGPRFEYGEYTEPPLLAATTGYYVLLDVEHVRFPLQLRFGGQFKFPGGSFTLDITYNIYKP